MWAEDIDALLIRARSGDEAVRAELTQAVQKDLQVFVAAYALDQRMVDAVFAASWADGQRTLMEAIQPAGDAQAGLFMGQAAGEPGSALAKRIRDLALVRLRQGLATSDQQAISAQDTLLHLIAQAGLEALPNESASAPAVPQLIQGKLRNLPPTANGLLTKRYAEGHSLVQIAAATGRDAAELSAALSMARSAVDWQSGGAMLFDPGDSEFPTLIEEFIAGTIAYDVRLRLAESLLRDIGRTAGFIRQVRLDLVLTAYAQEPRAPERLPVAEPPKSRTSTRLTMPPGGIPALHEAHRGATMAGRAAKHGPAGSTARLVLLAGGVLLVLAVIAGGFSLATRAPAHPAHAPASSTATSTPTATTSAAHASITLPAEPGNVLTRTPIPPASGAVVARIDSGQAIVTRAGSRYLLKAGAQLPAGEALETESGPLVIGLSAGRSLTIGVNSLLRGLTIGDGQVETAQLERGQARLDGPEGAHAVAIGAGRALAVGNGAAFTVTTTDDGMRLEVAHGTVNIQRSGLPPLAVRDHRLALVHDRGEVELESSGAFVAAIKLGGPGVVVDGRRWKSQLQAQSDGLKVGHGTIVAAGSLRDVDPALRPLLDPALAGAAAPADAVQLDLSLPAGSYDVVGWVVGQPGSDAGLLSVGNGKADNDQPPIGAHGWLRLQPIRSAVIKGHCHISYLCQLQQLLAGLEIFAIDTDQLPPSVFLTTPYGDQAISAPATLVLAADAYAPRGAIRAVEFLVDGVKLGEAATAPYTLPWTVQAPGAHALTALALADNGLSATTLPITVTVAAKHQAALLLTVAEEGGPAAGPAVLVLNAAGDHVDGAVAKVEFFADGMRIGEAVTAPFSLRWGRPSPGEHLITAIAHLSAGASLAGEPLKVVVQPPARPPLLAVIESPEDGAEVPDSSHLTIRVKAASRDGRVTRVDYFADEQKVGESTVSPFSYIWTRATAGLHHLRVVANDEHGLSAASEAVTVLIGKNVPFVLARGIHLGGEAVEIDGFRWVAQEEALRSGLTVKGAKTVGELALPAQTANPGLAALLGAGLLPEGEEIALSQSLPNGIYQISLWLSEAKAGASPPIELELQGVRQSLSSGRMGKAAWARYGPFTARVANQALTLVLHAGHGAVGPRLHGLAISVPLSGGAPVPRPLVELMFNAINGALTPNTGLTAGIAPTATISADGPQRGPIASPGGGSGGMDFGKNVRPAAIDVLGLTPALRGLKSFTLSAWLNNRVAQENGGGDRILCWLRDGVDGAELVYHDDGSLQLSVNSQVDGPGAARRSSPGLISSNDGAPLDNWRFVAVTFDATQAAKQVRYYVGSGTERASLDSAVDQARGPVGMNTAPELTIGHTYVSNRKPGFDRMYRGIIDQVRIWGSASDGSGALNAEQIISVQAAANPAALHAAFERSDPVVAQGLVAWFNAAAGISSLGGRVSHWEDLTGKHHDLVQDAPAQRPLLVDGQGAGGAALACTGEQHLELGGAAGLDPETFTLMAWARYERFEPAGDQRRWVVGKNGNELDAGHFSLLTANGIARAYLNLGGEIKLLELSSPAGAMHEHAWHLLAMTYDGERLALYLDGKRMGEALAHAKRSPGTGSFMVGRRPDNFGSCDGQVGEVRLYERALAEGEIQLIERTTRARCYAIPGAAAAGTASGGTQREVMLWDGEGPATGGGWSVPAEARIALQDAVACHGTHALQFHVSGSNYANCGWNWRSWGAGSPADDATAHACVIVALKVDGTAKPNSIRLVLRSPRPEDHNRSGDSDAIDLLPYCPTLLDGAWHDVAIPVKDITAKDAGFDLHHLFELSLFMNAPGAMESDVYIDDLGLGGKP
jgi:Concanavalin A-like lectin/glucanases superfamily/Bacterial Ig domain